MKTISVAVLGQGTYSDEATNWFFRGMDYRPVYCRTIAGVFEATVSGQTDYSVVPVENTIDGSVNLHIDWLVHEVDLPIQAEWAYPISVNLMAIPAEGIDTETRIRMIRKIASHPVALAQCRRYLSEHLPDALQDSVGSTSEGAKLVKESGDLSFAAVGPPAAAAMHNLDIIVPSIQDHQNNYTRFTLVGHQPLPQHNPGGVTPETFKTTFLLDPGNDVPGGLHQLLSAFAWRRLNLTKIESRPTKLELGTYYFYVDVTAPLTSVLLQGAIEEIRAIGCRVRIMGSYPSYRYGSTAQMEV